MFLPPRTNYLRAGELVQIEGKTPKESGTCQDHRQIIQTLKKQISQLQMCHVTTSIDVGIRKTYGQTTC